MQPRVRPLENLHRSGDQPVTPRSHVARTWMVIVRCAKYRQAFRVAVVRKNLLYLEHRQSFAARVRQGYSWCFFEQVGGFLVHRQRDRQGPGKPVSKTHVVNNRIVICASHEAFERTEGPDREHFQVRNFEWVQLDYRQLASFRFKPCRLFSGYQPIDEPPSVGFDHFIFSPPTLRFQVQPELSRPRTAQKQKSPPTFSLRQRASVKNDCLEFDLQVSNLQVHGALQRNTYNNTSAGRLPPSSTC